MKEGLIIGLVQLIENVSSNYIKELCPSGDPFPAKQQSFPSQGIGYHSVSGVSLSVMGITQCPVCL